MLSFCPRVGTEAGFSFCCLKIRSQTEFKMPLDYCAFILKPPPLTSAGEAFVCFYFPPPSIRPLCRWCSSRDV